MDDEFGTEAETKPAYKDQSRAIRLLIASLKIDSKRMNLHVIRDLIEIGKPAVPHLIEALADADERVWRLASAALVKIGTEAVEELVQALQHENAQVWLLAAVLYKSRALKKGDPGWGSMWFEYQKLVSKHKAGG